jgi:hypothetical protein
MNLYCAYNLADGSIYCIGYAAQFADADIFKSATRSTLELDAWIDPSAYYVRLSDTTLQPKAALPTFNKLALSANGIDAAVIAAGLPNPTQVSVSGDAQEAFAVTDGTLSLSFSAPGTYHVSIDGGAPFLLYTATITAT